MDKDTNVYMDIHTYMQGFRMVKLHQGWETWKQIRVREYLYKCLGTCHSVGKCKGQRKGRVQIITQVTAQNSTSQFSITRRPGNVVKGHHLPQLGFVMRQLQFIANSQAQAE